MIDAASTEKSTTSSSNNHYIADVANWTSFRVLDMRPSCLFRWELYPFFMAFDNISVASPPPPPLAARDHPLLIRPVLSTMKIAKESQLELLRLSPFQMLLS
uniref:Uncharacterized protein n=1 Tax=Brassica oleracea TaxID=3712 RepID=A0A3P6EZ24_BRAOL|nr:unnamed protein product [Brassica oleracea]